MAQAIRKSAHGLSSRRFQKVGGFHHACWGIKLLARVAEPKFYKHLAGGGILWMMTGIKALRAKSAEREINERLAGFLRESPAPVGR